jgi:hypothetical protein
MGKQGFLRDVLAIVVGFGTISTKNPNLRCPNCRTEVAAPREDGPVLSVDHLEDYRKYCWWQWKTFRNMGQPIPGLAPEMFAELLAKLERSLRFLEALTLEERLQPERIGEVERERARIASDTTTANVEQLFEEFTGLRDFSRDYREKPLPGERYAWLIMVWGVGAFAAGMGAAVWAQHNSVVAAILHVLGYSFVTAVVVFLCLTRVKTAILLVSSSRRRFCLFAFVLPGALGVGLYLLLHDAVVQMGLEFVPLILGCSTVMWLLIFAYASISTEVTVWRVRRAARATGSDHGDREAQASP